MRALLLVGLVAGIAPAAASAQIRPEQRPPGVTDSAIAWGKALFHGPANCSVCHGEGGRGTDRDVLRADPHDDLLPSGVLPRDILSSYRGPRLGVAAGAAVHQQP